MNAREKHLFIDTVILDMLKIQKKLFEHPDLFSPETNEAVLHLWHLLHADQRTFSAEINKQTDELFIQQLDEAAKYRALHPPEKIEAILAFYGPPSESGDVLTHQAAMELFDQARGKESVFNGVRYRCVDTSIEGDEFKGSVRATYELVKEG